LEKRAREEKEDYRKDVYQVVGIKYQKKNLT